MTTAAEKITPTTITSPDAIVQAGVRTLATERAALEALEAALQGSLAPVFLQAVQLMLGCTGRVIISGMGKSGHIARKMAATLASTGTPAHFVHPGEASHGDLGMLVAGDVVVLISNGGESPELADLIYHTKRFSMPLIAITSKRFSTLGKAGTLVLELPQAPEACPMGMAPTTSTTLTLALGDALAVALMEARGFNQQDYGVRHPGGRLGKMLLKVSDIMLQGEAMPLVPSATAMTQALVVISAKRQGCVGVVNGAGQLVGMITDGDLRRAFAAGTGAAVLAGTVDDLMTKNPKTIAPDRLAPEAVHLMNNHSITNVFVVDENQQPVGMLHLHDCLRAGIA